MWSKSVSYSGDSPDSDMFFIQSFSMHSKSLRTTTFNHN